MVFFANLGVNLHVCLCGGLQAAVAQTFEFFDISHGVECRLCTRA